MDTIYYWTGFTIINLLLISLILVFIRLLGYLIWTYFLQYIWYRYKHLFPKWQYSQDYINEWEKSPQGEVIQKGRFVIIKFKEPTSIFHKKSYVLVKK